MSLLSLIMIVSSLTILPCQYLKIWIWRQVYRINGSRHNTFILDKRFLIWCTVKHDPSMSLRPIIFSFLHSLFVFLEVPKRPSPKTSYISVGTMYTRFQCFGFPRTNRDQGEIVFSQFFSQVLGTMVSLLTSSWSIILPSFNGYTIEYFSSLGPVHATDYGH